MPVIILAQTKDYIKITGTVSDNITNNPLPYVSLSTETNLGTLSNSDGRVVLKYPKELASTELYISYIGYKTTIIILPETDIEDMIFKLNPDTFSVQEVTVLPLKAEEIITMAIKNIASNYHDTTIYMDAFYRKTKNNTMSLELRNNNYFFKELPVDMMKQAVFTLKKESVNEKKTKELRRVNAFKYEMEKNGVDSIISAFKAVLSPSMDSVEILEFDSVSNVIVEKLEEQSLSKDDFWEIDQFDVTNKRKDHLVLSDKALKKYYVYTLKDIVKYNDRQTYVIDISPISCKKDCFFSGTIYIDLETYAFVKELYFLDDQCEKCYKSQKIFGMTRTPISFQATVTYKKYKSFWGLSHASFNEVNDINLGKNIFATAYLLLKLQGKLKKDRKEYFPRSIYHVNNNTTEFFVNDIYMHDDIGFDGDNTIKGEIVDQINTDNKDIWGKYNYLETP